MREVMQNNYQEYDSGNDINFSEERPYTAVVTSDGLFISHYLDDINKVRIYRAGDEESELIDIRPIPGKECRGIARWKKFAGVLSDCSVILISDINSASRSILLNSGISVVTVEGFVQKSLQSIASGRRMNFLVRENTYPRTPYCRDREGACDSDLLD